MQQHGVFAEPAQAATIRPVAFQQGAGVHIRPGPYPRLLVLEKGNELFQLFCDDIVIVRSSRIGGHATPQFVLPIHLRQHGWRVGEAQADDAAGLRKRNMWIDTSLGFPG